MTASPSAQSHPSSVNQRSALSRRLWIVVLILLLAAAVRIVNAGHFVVWTDEGWSTWAASDHNLDVIINNVLTKDRHPPLFELSLSAWWTLAGDSRIALRFLAIAAGLITVAALYRLSADWFGVTAGRYAALLLTVLPGAVYYSQEIRDYGWLMLAVTLMTLCFLRLLRRQSRAAWAGYVLSVVFMLYTLYIGGLILVVQGGIGLLRWRKTGSFPLALFGAWLVSGLLYIPWLLLLPRQLSFIGTGITPLPTSWAGLITAAGVLLGGQLALTAGLYALGVWRIIEQRQGAIRWWAQMTLVLSSVGLFGLLFVANIRFGLLAARIVIFMAPLFMAICGYGLSLLAGRTRAVLTVGLIVVLLTTSAPIQPRLDYDHAAQAVAADYMPGDLIILENGWDDNAFRYELLLALGDNAAPDIVRTLPWVDNRTTGDPVLPRVELLIKAKRRVWLINWLQPSQVSGFLAGGGDGFQQVISHETPTGAQYASLFADQNVRETLYEQPQPISAAPIARFGDNLLLHDALLPATLHAGQRTQIDLWWRTAAALPRDYSVSVFVMDSSGVVRAQSDQSPHLPTSQWPPDTLEFDRHTLTLPADLAAGPYRIGVDVYWYGDQQRLPVSGAAVDAAHAEVMIGTAALAP